ncbi:MAG: hypothetical protein CSB46_02245 [Micrococcales bacterium]|nr:MAG: hypothetical protein CSB46_02245 [Micrococcales bacterium]
MVPADTAGVLFTRNPVTGDESTMLASSSYGLGESVVAALVTPDTFSLSRGPRAVSSREIGSKQTRIDQVPGGGTITTDVPERDRARQSLTDTQLLRLLALGERVEAHYQVGQDIEWAFAGDELYLLQARPITTSTTHPRGHAPVEGRIAPALRNAVIEHFPAPFPLDLYAVHRVMDALGQLMRLLGLRPIEATSLIRGDDDGIIGTNVAKPDLSPGLLVRLPRMMAAGARYDPSRWPEDEATFRERVNEMAVRAQELPAAADDASLQLVREAAAEVVSISVTRYSRYALPMFLNLAIASVLISLARQHHTTKPQDLYLGAPYKTAEITTAVAELAATARGQGIADTIVAAEPGAVGAALASDVHGPEFQAHVAVFLAEHGARTPKPWLPFSNRSWREEPEALFALLAASLRGTHSKQNQPSDPAPGVERRLLVAHQHQQAPRPSRRTRGFAVSGRGVLLRRPRRHGRDRASSGRPAPTRNHRRPAFPLFPGGGRGHPQPPHSQQESPYSAGSSAIRSRESPGPRPNMSRTSFGITICDFGPSRTVLIHLPSGRTLLIHASRVVLFLLFYQMLDWQRVPCALTDALGLRTCARSQVSVFAVPRLAQLDVGGDVVRGQLGFAGSVPGRVHASARALAHLRPEGRRAEPDVYHGHDDCPTGQRIPARNRVAGTGGYQSP